MGCLKTASSPFPNVVACNSNEGFLGRARAEEDVAKGQQSQPKGFVKASKDANDIVVGYENGFRRFTLE
ncbi:hypothetical protein [Sagittula sp. P11]|uniref:hypothetical protein n=1 Tax=Sagittula sp. P11 TaxID=2009329 RepID=UPI0012FE33FA|nr:hypothetical protein [Sagittula sp. P11]